jgi:hypothetical protein
VQSLGRCFKLADEPRTKLESTTERQKRDGAKMNRVVNSTLRYVPEQGEALSRRGAQAIGPAGPSFPISSTEVRNDRRKRKIAGSSDIAD